MKLTLADKIAISPDVLFQEVVGETVLLDLADESFFGLDAVGTRVWQLIQEHSCLRAVYDVMLEEYEVAPSRLHQDLLDHVGDLVDAGLVALGTDNAAAL